MFFAVALALFVAAEFVIGWWALPLVGFVLGLVGARRRGGVAIITGAALMAWILLFAWTATYGNLGGFMQSLAASMKLKPNVFVAVLGVVPALLAGAAARLGAGLRPDSAVGTPSEAALNG